MDRDILGYVLLLIVSIGLVQYKVYSYKSDDADYKSAYVRMLKESKITDKESESIVSVIQSETKRNRETVASVANAVMFMFFSVLVSFRVYKKKNENEAAGVNNHA